MSPGWPAELAHGDIGLRPLRRRDLSAWREVRLANEGWLAPWEGSPPSARPASWEERHSPAVFRALLRGHDQDASAGRAFPFGITVDDRLAGQVNVASVIRGAFDSASIGYWVDGRLAGRGIAPLAVALAIDHVFTTGLHRVEANIRPENAPSLRVVEKLGLRAEGRHERFLFIDGAWRDHLSYAVVREDVPDGLLRRYLSRVPG